jgi:hypothetical protein
MEKHLDLKDFLLSPKMSDRATTWYYLEGWRICEISIGSKFIHIKPLFGGYSKKKIGIRKGKALLKNMYWKAAKCDAYFKAIAEGKKRKPKNWEKLYA